MMSLREVSKGMPRPGSVPHTLDTDASSKKDQQRLIVDTQNKQSTGSMVDLSEDLELCKAQRSVHCATCCSEWLSL